MTKLTVNGVSTTTTPGQEQHEYFYRGTRSRKKRYCAYEYRHTDGELFAIVKPTLKECIDARVAWMEAKEEKDDGDLDI